MKHLLFATLAALCLTAATAAAQTAAPLRPVCADSIYLMDFFWSGVQTQAMRTPVTTATAEPQLRLKTLRHSQLAELESQWDKTLDSLDILGERPHTTLSQSLSLFRQCCTLHQLTRRAKYMDLAEHLLANSILPRWQSEAPGAAKDEATLLLRNVRQLAFSVEGSHVYANIPMRANAHIKTPSMDLYLRSVNSSPWYNETTISISNSNAPVQLEDYDSLNIYQKKFYHDTTVVQPPCQATLHLRIPQWATGQTPLRGLSAATLRKSSATVMVNGTVLNRPASADGYIAITREWTVGDVVTIRIPTPIVRLTPLDQPATMALQRGPFVYYYIGTDDGDSLSRQAAIDHEFSRQDRAVVLSGKLSDGKRWFFAQPYYLGGKKDKIFVPAT